MTQQQQQLAVEYCDLGKHEFTMLPGQHRFKWSTKIGIICNACYANNPSVKDAEDYDGQDVSQQVKQDLGSEGGRLR